MVPSYPVLQFTNGWDMEKAGAQHKKEQLAAALALWSMVHALLAGFRRCCLFKKNTRDPKPDRVSGLGVETMPVSSVEFTHTARPVRKVYIHKDQMEIQTFSDALHKETKTSIYTK